MLRKSNNLPVLVHLLLWETPVAVAGCLPGFVRLLGTHSLRGALRSLYRLRKRTTKAASGGDVKLADGEYCRKHLLRFGRMSVGIRGLVGPPRDLGHHLSGIPPTQVARFCGR